MKCKQCNEKAVFLNPKLCKKHFIEDFENRVKETIKEFNLVKKSDKIVVACSGGKDSTTILYLLKKFGANVEALSIDEGIVGYHNKTLKDLKGFCKEYKIKLKIYSFEDNIGKKLDNMIDKKSLPCTICGTFRRSLMNKYAKGYDKIATGHNMDDESQAVLMNLVNSNTDLLNHSVPITKKLKGFVQKIKPLYFIPEKEVAAYSLLKGFNVNFTECPYVNLSFRQGIRDKLNSYATRQMKTNILRKHLQVLSVLELNKQDYGKCSICGQPSKNKICRACELAKNLNKTKGRTNQ